MHSKLPDLADLYRLSRQLERDRDLAIDDLQRRDHRIASECKADSDRQTLLNWLDRVSPDQRGLFRSEGIAVTAVRVVAFLLGFSAMSGVLLGSGNGLVNALLILLLFVFIQLLLSLISSLALLRTVRNQTSSRSGHPAAWLVGHSMPELKNVRELRPVLRPLMLRYGQEWGFLFTAAALLAFVAVPAVNDFSFVWGSTFALSENFVVEVTRYMALPWAVWLPDASPNPELIASSRYHPAIKSLDQTAIESMRGWWSFLFMSTLCYGLMPRFVIWVLAQLCYRRQIQKTFLQLPGTELVLLRLRAPLIRTQGEETRIADKLPRQSRQSRPAPIRGDRHTLVVDWADALAGVHPQQFEELLNLATENVQHLGSGSLQSDRQTLDTLKNGACKELLLIVKSWEPPVAELADLLSELSGFNRCIIYLRPLPQRPVPHRKIEDWREFCRKLPFPQTEVRLLNPVMEP